MSQSESSESSVEKTFSVGDRVRVVALPAYLKTAEPMPMLRPPNVIQLGEEGVVLDRRPGGFWGVRFSRGVFLMDAQYLEVV
ncbi:MAG: regulatory protein SipA [Elainella sp.]